MPSETPTNIDELAVQLASEPKRVQGDSGSVEQHSIHDLIELDKHLAAKKAAKSKGMGIRFAQLVPDGTV